ncbi:MAG TPA: TetR/AcrR family transcriptional regulator [Micavibrio sp.]|nr:TetR/AcrR family transcriptional regulator [Micavibrio sp.]
MPAKKAKSSLKTTQIPLKERVVTAALDLASRMGWEMVTMTDIADKAHTNLAGLFEIFDDKSDILAAYGRRIDKVVLGRAGDADPSVLERDRLFDLLMERFDVLNEDRDAVLSILKSFTSDPKQAVISLPHLGRSMAWTLEAAGIDTSGLKGAARVTGLALVYMNALRQWGRDDSADLSKTMAALDKSLSRAERWANSFML